MLPDKINKVPKPVVYMRIGVHKIIKTNNIQFHVPSNPDNVIDLRTNKKGKHIDIYV
jgi:hypothetical protein